MRDVLIDRWPPRDELGFDGDPSPGPGTPQPQQGSASPVVAAVQRAHAAVVEAHGRYLARLLGSPVTSNPTDPGSGPGFTARLDLTGSDPTELVRGVLLGHARRLALADLLPEPSARPRDAADHHVRLSVPAPSGPVTALVQVRDIGLTPRPYVLADCRLLAESAEVARMVGIGIELVEGPGTHIAATAAPAGRAVARRRCADGRRAVINEFHLAHLAEGDITLAFDVPGRVLARVRPRLPNSDLLMISRSPDPARPFGRYEPGATLTTEYDVPADPWYLRENGTPVVPHLAYLETSLQGAAFLGVSLGMSLEHPEADLVVRNLEGRATLHRTPALVGRTITQHSTLLSHAELPQAVVQRYAYELSLGGEVFYSGETAYGVYPADALGADAGLDGAVPQPPWLRANPGAGARTIEARTDPRLGRGRMALLDRVELVPDGGVSGLGYALATAAIDPDAWYFARHFHQDPVMPGSFGIEMLHQAVHAHLLHTPGLADHLPAVRLAPATGAEFSWSYRGQVLPRHRQVQAEVHLTEISRHGPCLTVRARGSVWRDGTRVYQAEGIGVTLGPAGTERELS
ncbi:3-hydroxyacyl-ACP dehydratase [Streptomyces sp. NPDC059564]|uniref:3-hydroxyacyl-ACP dehydratase n=1 Tax=Streptomyces sp. NPDC059564 TaxID=3346865 RepID=UPI003673FD58